ncbi:MAG: prepilin-type N-terminal cleavage/methylation domain-containing protein [Xanthomonadales bacterium]|nr:prepilin-type N-terminal cleavage/methylation domain-containing protein [Xanthomonadales bacterium]
MSIKLNNVKGFTIVEALVAFVVFSFGALVISVFLTRSLEMNADSEARSEALHLAKESIAGFRNFARRDDVVAYATDATGNTIVGNNATFTRTWTVADVAGNDNAILLTVDVDWTGVNGAQNVSLASQIAKLKPETTGGFLMAQNVPGVGSLPIGTDPPVDPPIDPHDDQETDPPVDPPIDPPIDPPDVETDPSSTYFTCACVWEATTSGFCETVQSVSSTPAEPASCCSASVCGLAQPDTKMCKKRTATVYTSCGGSQ